MPWFVRVFLPSNRIRLFNPLGWVIFIILFLFSKLTYPIKHNLLIFDIFLRPCPSAHECFWKHNLRTRVTASRLQIIDSSCKIRGRVNIWGWAVIKAEFWVERGKASQLDSYINIIEEFFSLQKRFLKADFYSKIQLWHKKR